MNSLLGVTAFTIYFDQTVTCRACGDTITSLYRHDYQTCECGDVSVDGGRDYIRRGARGEAAHWEEWTGAWERDREKATNIEYWLSQTRLGERSC